MPYPEQIVTPMRKELTQLGVEECKSADEVDAAFASVGEGTMTLVVNSVCGCAAANARPAIALARQAAIQPDQYATVFAGQDLEATARAREYLTGVPPSSPFIAVMKAGEPVFVLERRHIEGRTASAIASDLVEAYVTHCGDGKPSGNGSPSSGESASDLPETFRSIL